MAAALASRQELIRLSGSSPPLPYTPHGGLVSDVVDLTGVGSNLYVLEMTYDPGLLNAADTALLASRSLFLGSLDGGEWTNAVTANSGNNASLAQQAYSDPFSGVGSFQSLYGTTLADYIGAWGVDTVNNKAWAVLNHNSEFAVVPEPGTFAMLLFGGVMLWVIGRKRV